jgi:hypothetical protein
MRFRYNVKGNWIEYYYSSFLGRTQIKVNGVANLTERLIQKDLENASEIKRDVQFLRIKNLIELLRHVKQPRIYEFYVGYGGNKQAHVKIVRFRRRFFDSFRKKHVQIFVDNQLEKEYFNF